MASINLDIKVTPLQKRLIDSPAFFTMFGGAAGGGKSHGLLVKYFLYCMRYPGAKCLILRRTFPELQRSLIRLSLTMIPKALGRYNESKHIWFFVNGSILEFGYCESENDVTNYQSAEYDRIGFDESTHFTEYQITYMVSRCRGINNFPKGLDMATNPGNVGHMWHKMTFIDGHLPFDMWEDADGLSYLFIPAKVKDNPYLLASDPDYVRRLKKLPEAERRMLEDGDWDVFAGQYFSCWRKDTHVIRPFEIPDWWQRFNSLDYGLDCTACYDWAVDNFGTCYITKELYKPDLTLSMAAKEILAWRDPVNYSYIVASPDLWNRRQVSDPHKPETGISGIEHMQNAGLYGFIKADNRRVPGWETLNEFLLPRPDESGGMQPKIFVFENCVNLIRTLPALIRSDKNPNDVSDKCEDHAPESVRYGAMSRPPLAVTNEDREYRRRRREREVRPVVSDITNY
jgi:hypothetical protein